MLKIEKNAAGNLELSIPEKDDRDEIAMRLANNPENQVYCDLLEPYSTNGSYTNINSETCFVGLTSDPYLIAESVDIADNGQVNIIGDLWHYNYYMIKSAVELLAAGQTVILTKV